MKLGIIGYPLTHSLSDKLHNIVLSKLGYDVKYELIKINSSDDLPDFLREAKERYIGLNVTSPYKEKVMNFLNYINEEAKLIGAVNTIKFNKKRIDGYNTDAFGFDNLIILYKVETQDREALVIGGGGAARAAIYSLLKLGSCVSIVNRKIAKSLSVGSHFIRQDYKINVVTFDCSSLKEAVRKADILINATPVGMYPHIDESIISGDYLRDYTTVIDLVYNPFKTKLIKLASEKGCQTLNGVDMFVAQAAKSLNIWLEKNIPLKLVRETFDEL